MLSGTVLLLLEFEVFLVVMRVARAAHWMLRGVILLGDYGLINLTACSLTVVPPRPEVTREH